MHWRFRPCMPNENNTLGTSSVERNILINFQLQYPLILRTPAWILEHRHLILESNARYWLIPALCPQWLVQLTGGQSLYDVVFSFAVNGCQMTTLLLARVLNTVHERRFFDEEVARISVSRVALNWITRSLGTCMCGDYNNFFRVPFLVFRKSL